MMDNSEVLSNIAAENAALKIKIKQEYDKSCAIVNEINTINSKINICERENKQYDEMFQLRNSELKKSEDELDYIYSSRERVQINIENLKKQYEFMLIEEEQKEKERSSVRSNYEIMIRNQKEIYNSYPSVMKKINLQNKLTASSIHLAILQRRVEDMKRIKRQFYEIQELKLKNAIIELAKVYTTVKQQETEKKNLILQINEKTSSFQKFMEEKEKSRSKIKFEEDDTPSVNSTSSTFVSNKIKNIKPAVNVPTIIEAKENHLLQYFEQLKSFKISHTPFVLPPSLSQSFSSSMKNISSDICDSKSSSPKREIHEMLNSSREIFIKNTKNDYDLSNQNAETEKEESDNSAQNIEDGKTVENDASNISLVTNTSVHTDKMQTPDSINTAVSLEMTNQIRNINLNNRINDISKPSNSLLDDAKINCERVQNDINNTSKSRIPIPTCSSPFYESVQKDINNTPKSRIPVLNYKSPFRNNVSRIPVTCSPSPKIPSSLKIRTITSPRSAHIPAFKNVRILESPLKLSKENICRLDKRMDMSNPKNREKQSKIDYGYAQWMEMKKLKRKPFHKKDTQFDTTNINSNKKKMNKNTPYAGEIHTISNPVIPRKNLAQGFVLKQNVNARINNNEKIQKFLNLVENQFPDDVKNIRNAMYVNSSSERQKCYRNQSQNNLTEKSRKSRTSLPTEQNLYDFELIQCKNVSSPHFVPEMETNLNQQPQFSDASVYGELMEQEEFGRDKNSIIINTDENLVDIVENSTVDVEKNVSNKSGKETYSRKVNEENCSKYFSDEELRKKFSLDTVSVQEPYVENYQSDNENTYVGSDGGPYGSGSVDLNYEHLYPDTYSPISDTFSVATSDTQPFVMFPSEPSANGSAFRFGSSINQIFSSIDESIPNDGGESGSFSFNFTEQKDNQQSFRFY